MPSVAEVTAQDSAQRSATLKYDFTKKCVWKKKLSRTLKKNTEKKSQKQA